MVAARRQTYFVYGVYDKRTESLDGMPLDDVRRILRQSFNFPPDVVSVINGEIVTGQSLVPPGATVTFLRLSGGRKGNGENLSLVVQLLHGVNLRLNDQEKVLQEIHLVVSRPKAEQDWYSTAQFGKVVDRDEYTVREWCRLGRLHAQKTCSGRGNRREWRIPQAELARYRKEGLLPLPRRN